MIPDFEKEIKIGNIEFKIPNEWNVAELNKCSEIILSNVDKKSYSDEMPVKLCNYMDVYYNKYISNQIDFMKATATKDEIRKFKLLKNDVILTKDSETPDDIGIPTLVSEELKNVLCGYHLALIRSKRNQLLGEFLSKLLQVSYYNSYFHFYANGVTRFGLTKDVIENIPILLPPLPEQKKIAEILSSVDETIQATQKVIEQTCLVKKGLLQELLTKGIGHTKFKKVKLGTEVVEIPVEWEVKKLGDVLSIQGGYAFSSKNASSSGIRWFKIANVGIEYINWNDKSYLPNEFVIKYKEYILKENDIVMAMTRPLLGNKLKVAIIKKDDVPSLLNQRVCRIILNNTAVDNYYIYSFFRTQYIADRIQKTIFGTDPPNISSYQIESIQILFPPLPEQKQIAEILSSVDKSIRENQKKLEQLKQVKKGLMQDLLTGKVRVKV